MYCFPLNFESGRIRRRFRQECWQIKKTEKLWLIELDSYSFSNAIHLIVFWMIGKWVNLYFNAFCFFRIWFWKGQHDLFHTRLTNLALFLKNLVFSGSPLHEIWSVSWMRFSLTNLLHFKWRDDPEITKMLCFGFIFGLKIC